MSYDTNPFVLVSRSKVFVWDDPQRRCYNGAFGAHHFEDGPWEVLDRLKDQETADRKLKFWRELNDYAVSQRGEGSRKEFKIEYKEQDEPVEL